MSHQRIIHFINPMNNATGGSEWRTLELYRALQPHRQVHIWSPFDPDPALLEAYPIRPLDAGYEYPQGGVVVLVGVFFEFYATWLQFAKPRRVIVIYNTDSPGQLKNVLNVLQSNGVREIEVVFAWKMLQTMVGLPGIVQLSLIDMAAFTPKTPSTIVRGTGRRFTVGRLSRDEPDKHHLRDARVYRRLLQAGCGIRLMGASSLAGRIGGDAAVQILPAGTEPAPAFLQQLDCFFYRTSVHFLEPSGRVVTEAMACALPVVCHTSGGYREYIEHGKNGFLFESDEQAVRIILQLKQDPAMAGTIGQAARRNMETLFSPVARQAVLDYYLR